MNFDYEKFYLPNGLRVALLRTENSTVNSKLRVNYGAVHEMPGEEGLAHFLEHCIMTGGSTHFSIQQSDDVRSKLGHSNAKTSLGRTFLEADMLPRHLELWLAYASDSAFNLQFDAERVEGERGRIVREISDIRSSPVYRLNRQLEKILYRQHPISRCVIGSEQVVQNATIDQLREFHSRGYGTSNCDLILVGNLPENSRLLIEKYFSNQRIGANLRMNFPVLQPLEKHQSVHVSATDLMIKDDARMPVPQQSSADIRLSSVIAPDSHPDTFALSTLTALIGQGSTSRLFKKIGLKMGLAYSVGSTYQSEYNAGILHVQAKVPAVRVPEAVDAVFDEFHEIRQNGVNLGELDSFKSQVEFAFVKSLDSTDGKLSAIEYDLDKEQSPESRLKGFNSVTADKILEVARKYLPADRDSDNYLLAIRDPLKQD